jgi:hyperosmotically inducible periplasmic protein
MRLIRAVLLLLVIAVVAVLVYNYNAGYGWTLSAPDSSGIDADGARDTAADLAEKAAATARTAAGQAEAAVAEGALTAKIKSKMALDDLVKARTIDVDTAGSVVTLAGRVQSIEERERAVRLAKETAGVTNVVDRLEVGKP